MYLAGSSKFRYPSRRDCCALVVASAINTGCASLSTIVYSTSDSRPPPEDGLLYYMPRQGILVTVTLDSKGVRSVNVDSALPEPDYRQYFVLQYNSNFVGANHLSITVSPTGLLQSAGSTVTSGVNQIAKNLAADLGAISAVGFVASPTSKCLAGETYHGIIHPDPKQPNPIMTICGLTISINRQNESLPPSTERLPVERAGVAARRSEWHGIFYRQQIAYLVTAEDSAARTKNQFVGYSTDESPTLYYPVSKSFFANNQNTLTLVDGVLKQVDQSTDGELVGLTQLPADIISGYFGAVGNVFSQIGTASSNKATADANQANVLLAQMKLKACQQVIAANSISDKKGDDLKNALDAIKAACQ